ncbi:MAG: hypothetical protein AUJ32_00360 [Parcubacteria group bacterium CG1_02_40_82]|uniref:Uncharacterized protein n=2 Tax=Candidatus Portnoyibacteriota TaxID=1817913 RepID=A0A2H0KTB4_9BACT|nr:MAG: hypothetical protein AUJ32_00360 [Parcubacteria group bacterium CG1_02_40_82]PIQ75401.1 MAG: hypothetical protein COV84_01325 [Candidatus Portnoybacteria bacterium CG11_big_fil_rev_8_21_14_0_20_40_15]
MFTTALIIFNFLMTVYVVFGLAILFHLRKYRWPGDLSSLSAVIFIVGSVFLLLLTIVSFLSFPWQSA